MWSSGGISALYRRPHDAEALLVDSVTGDLFIVTKRISGREVYAIAADRLKDQAVAKLTAVGKLDADEVSAGAVSPDGSHIILRRGSGLALESGGRQNVSAALEKAEESPRAGGK
jgi:hypothetical protein